MRWLLLISRPMGLIELIAAGCGLLWIIGHFPGNALATVLLFAAAVFVFRWLRRGVGAVIRLPTLPWRLYRQHQASDLHGSARWANGAEQRAWSEGDGTIYLGCRHDFFGRLRPVKCEPTVAHIAVVGSSGAGKSSGVLIPSLLSIKTSCVTLDPKGELYSATAYFRSRVLGQRVLYFAPGEAHSVAFNFLETVRINTVDEVEDCKMLAMALCGGGPSAGSGGKGDPFWHTMAEALLSAVILFVRHAHAKMGAPTANFGDVADALFNPIFASIFPVDPEQPDGPKQTTHLFEEMAKDPHPHISLIGSSNHLLEDKTKSGVLAEAQRMLLPWSSPVIRRNTSSSDFQLSDLWDGDQPVSVYCVTRADRAEAMSSINRLFLSVLTMQMQSREPGTGKNHVVLVCEEFTALKHSAAVENSLPRLRGFNCTVVVCVQSVESLTDIYGPHAANVILANCNVKTFMGLGTIADAEYVSRSLGMETRSFVSRHSSITTGRGGSGRSTTSALNWIGRRLVTEDEALVSRQMFVWRTSERALRCDKIRFWENPVFAARSTISPNPADPIPAAANDDPFPLPPIFSETQRRAMALAAGIVVCLACGWGALTWTAPARPAGHQAAAPDLVAAATALPAQRSAYEAPKPAPPPTIPKAADQRVADACVRTLIPYARYRGTAMPRDCVRFDFVGPARLPFDGFNDPTMWQPDPVFERIQHDQVCAAPLPPPDCAREKFYSMEPLPPPPGGFKKF